MIDFTPQAYTKLCNALIACNINSDIRHDVDKHPDRALRIAQIEQQKGLKATYYFRARDFGNSIIKQIAELGHDIGYHYETLDSCNGDIQAAYDEFCRNLETLRISTHIHVEKMCAHGSPRSMHNNQTLWCHYDYHCLGITHDSMIDTDFGKTLYLTDTGRCWDGYQYSVRDKVSSMQTLWSNTGLSFHTTEDIIHALNDLQHPIHKQALLINTHPQRWMPMGAGWIKELVSQNIKNQVKRALICIKY